MHTARRRLGATFPRKAAPIVLLALLATLVIPAAFAPPAHAAGSVVADVANSCGGPSDTACNTTTNQLTAQLSVGAPGQALVVAVAVEGGATAPTISDSAGSSFVLLVANDYSASGYFTRVYYAPAKTSGSDTLTLTASAGVISTRALYVFDLSGVTLSGNKSVTGTAVGSSSSETWTDTTGSTLSFTSGDFIMSVVLDTNDAVLTAGSSFTTLANSNDPFAFAEFADTSGPANPSNFPISASTTTTTQGTGSLDYYEIGIDLPLALATTGTYSSSSACSSNTQTASFTAGTDTVYGGISASTTTGATWSLNYVEPDGTVAHTVSSFPTSSFPSCDSTGYTLPSNAPTGTWALEVLDASSNVVGSSSFTVSAPVPEFPLGALLLLLPMAALYLVLRRATPGKPLGG